MTATRRFWARLAWVDGRWERDVQLAVDADGNWCEVEPATAPAPEAEVLAGPVLPGLVDAHSHAFQRAFAGLAERRATARDDFWSWRDRMYRAANAVTPATLRAIAAQLQLELLAGGYTQVCEFHYLQHEKDGTPYDDPLALSMAVADAAAATGIGLTLLPVLYERAGFSAPRLRDDQLRFHASAEDVWLQCREFRRRVRAMPPDARARFDAGIAIHSVRAASAEGIRTLRRLADGFDGPIHIHVSEQRAEVEACIAETGLPPIAWLAQAGLDARWQLVHATHATPAEIAQAARAGAGVVLCPSTEGNLGDGLVDLPAWLEAGMRPALGSDSQVTRCWREELRWLEYGQRLALQRRNIAAAPHAAQRPEPATAARLFEAALQGGARAAGRSNWGLRVGARADLLVADAMDPALLGLPAERTLDALVFSSPSRPWRDVLVAGHWTLRAGRHPAAAEIAAEFSNAMGALWGEDG
ncbi:MAG TPA: formimidoylglutamate deiminase [Burkholderiaceae bacterium]|nr:formimidoylglutamate deiminase [Burkholderiaceae bacterium]